jgi:hypothetical protein
VIIKDNEDIINKYKENFNKLIENKERVKNVKDYLERNPYITDVFSSNNISVRELKIVNPLINLDSFIIRKVEYKQWRQDSYIEKIKVKNNNIVITFNTKTTADSYIHGSEARDAWLIRNTENHKDYIIHHKITNIKINGEIKLQELRGEIVCYFSNSNKIDFKNDNLGYGHRNGKLLNGKGEEIPIIHIVVPKEFDLSCEIHFEAKDFTDKTIDLTEGLKTDFIKKYWHCFKINMLLNREPL